MPHRLERLNNTNVASIVQLGKELVALGTFSESGPEFDWDYTMRNTLGALDNPMYYICAAVLDGEYVGFVAGHLDPMFFAQHVLGVEDCWFVREGTKGRAKIAESLMMSFVNWCMERGAWQVHSGDIASINTVGVDALYRHMGFTRFGVIYKYARAR